MDLKTILSKPIPVIWYRFKQLLKLAYCQRIGYWKKIESRIQQDKPVSKDKSLFFKSFIELEQTHECQEIANRVLSGKIAVFNVSYSFDFPLQWNEDWRHQYKWENTYYKNYTFYEKEKSIPYDVKFPWELSRLSFLLPVARAYRQTKSVKYLDFIFDILKDWKDKNPIAHSVNWYAMEVSVRSINLIQLREILLDADNSVKVVALLNEILILHGVFLWRNVEYTDVNGNHYSANLTALLLLGTSFKNNYPEAKKWLRYATNKLEKEFHLQFIKDGVNFEKSTQYHRLVVEFYLISFVVMQRINKPVKAHTLQLLKNACYFLKDITKPDKTTPVIGDNDSASVFQIENISLLNHSPILQLASVFLDEKELNITDEVYPFTREIFGNISFRKVKKKNTFESYFYKEGGYFIAKDATNYFITDVGEVGMNGRGGHGHNDLFSFELFLNNRSLIVDAGCYTYTGDLALKDKMKSTPYHNVLSIDNHEIAPIVGTWGISNIATPENVRLDEDEKSIIISGTHNGYQRLDKPVTHSRTFTLNKQDFSLTCIDNLQCNAKHQVYRYLHFSENTQLSIKGNTLIATKDNKQYLINFNTQVKLEIADYILSKHYGSQVKAQKAIIKDDVNANAILEYKIIYVY